MAENNRSTFSEHWYRVADLKARLIPAVRTHKQYFRNKTWHILQSPVNQEFFRLEDAGYAFVALLNGKRTVADAWRIANDRYGDDAPTQGEAIQLLGQLYQSNLVQAELPPDAENLFSRFHKRIKREMQAAAMGFLFPRFHVWDPDSFLNRWCGWVGWVFTGFGVLVWAVLAGLGLYALAERGGELYNSTAGVLSPANLPFLYLAFVVAKAIHEFAHGFACKVLGHREGEDGQVHDTGIMLLVFTPVPYVNATASWGFRSKWRRIVVAAAGMWSELALAAVAAMVWAWTSEGHAIHAIAYNTMFVASIATILFNGNPLLRYDAYYILCDALEMPNLAMRAQQYAHYLVKRYAWGVKGARHSAHGAWEKSFFIFYYVASTLYRMVLLAGILLTVSELAFFLGVAMAVASLVVWGVLPIFKLLRYLFTSSELSRVRVRAVGLTLLVFLCALWPLVTAPMPDRFRIEGVAESEVAAGVHAGSTGFLVEALPSNTPAVAGETVVAVLKNPALDSEWAKLLGREKEIQARLRMAEATDPSEAQAMVELLSAVREEMSRVERLRRELEVKADRDGLWVAPRIQNFFGTYIQHGQRLGEVISPGAIHIRSFPGQNEAVNLMTGAKREIELRVKGRPDLWTTGYISQILPAGRKELPSPVLGFPAGGETQVDEEDPQGNTSAEHLFEIKVELAGDAEWPLLPGQVVVIRFDTPEKPLFEQGWRFLRQLLQRRYHV